MSLQEEKIFRNPFEESNASHMPDDHIIKYWTCPKGFLEHGRIGNVEFTNALPNILFGGRGSGKTTILKYLSFDIQSKIFKDKNAKQDMVGFLNSDSSFLGIYYRFDGPILSSLKGKNVADEKWDIIFTQFFELVLGQIYLKMLSTLISEKALSDNIKEEILVEKICEEVFGNYDVQKYKSINDIKKEFSLAQHTIETWKDQIAFLPVELNIKPIPSGRILTGIPRVCSEIIPELQNKLIFYLLDEYENLSHRQQVIVNSLLKHRKDPISFKLGSRINGLKTKDTTTGEYLREGSDFRSIPFEYVAASNKANYRELLENIAKKRLEEHEILGKIPNVDIHMFLGKSLTPEEEAREIIQNARSKDRHFAELKDFINKPNCENKSLEEIRQLIANSDNPLIEKLNMLLLKRNELKVSEIHDMMIEYLDDPTKAGKYKNLYNKNKVGLLFQLISNYPPTSKLYSGFDIYRKLSSNIVRTFIELCYFAFNKQIFSDANSLSKGKEISRNIQTKAAEYKSDQVFEDILLIPEGLGEPISRFSDQIGNILKTLHRDERLSEPEQTYFSTDYNGLDGMTKKLINTAVMWSIFQEEESMEPKGPTHAKYKDYLLNHIFAPKYSISYNKRGRTIIIPEHVNKIAHGTVNEIKEIRQKLAKEGPEFLNQRTLSDYL